MSHKVKSFLPLKIAVMTVSDSRTAANDSTGDMLVQALQEQGHELVERTITSNDCYQIRYQLSAWIASAEVQVVLINGGYRLCCEQCNCRSYSP